MVRNHGRPLSGGATAASVAFLLSFCCSVAPLAAEVNASLEAMRAELRQMRQAYEGRIAHLESRLQELSQEKTESHRKVTIEQGINRALGEETPYSRPAATPPPAARSTLPGDSKVTVGGYTEFTYVDRGEKLAQFDQLRTVVELSAQIHERIRFYAECEYEHGGVVKDGRPTDGELELEQAYVDLLFHDKINFRAGVILVPLGRYNLYHEAWANNLVDRPLVDRYITPTTWFEEGVGFHGQAFDTDYLGISYEAYLFNPGRADRISHRDGFREVRNQNSTPIYDRQKAGAFRVAFEPARSSKWFADTFEIGFSGYVSGFRGGRQPKEDTGQMQIWSVDWNWEKKGFGLRGSAAMGNAAPHFAPAGDPTGHQAWGCSVEGFYQFWPKFLTKSAFGRGFDDPQLAVALRYDWVDLDLDRFDQRDMGRVTAGLSYRPTPRVVYKFDYQIDHSPSSRDDTTLSASGIGKNSDAFFFSVAVGF